MPSFFNDGYTYQAGISPVEFVHDGIEFTYRPSTPTDVSEFISEADGKTGIDLRRVHAKWLCDKIITWDFKQAGELKGKHPPKLEESIFTGETGMKIHATLMSRMLNVVVWGDKPDYGEECNMEDQSKN